MKILLLRFLILILGGLSFPHLAKANEEDEVFVVTNHACITNGSSAITLNLPFEAPLSDYLDSSFEPLNSDSNQNCHFDTDDSCKKFWIGNEFWQIQNTLNTSIRGIITDMRWERLPILQKSTKLEIAFNVHVLERDNFDISLSARLQEDGNIYLCESSELRTSNCLWIVLKANGKGSGIRKCGMNSIDPHGNPTKFCKKLHDQQTSEEEVTNAKSWKHFTIRKSNKNLEVMRETKTYLRFSAGKQFDYKLRHVLIGNDVGLWKIHDYNFLYNTNSSTSQLGPHIKPNNGTICISLFIVMCESCELRIILKKATRWSPNRIVFDELYTTKEEKWQEIKIQQAYITEIVGMHFETRASSEKGIFWALDDFRLCSEQEYRYLSTSGDEICQKITINNDKILGLQKQLSSKAIQCPKNTFGNPCLPCSYFFEHKKYCNGFKYCEVEKNSYECHCTAGYTGPSCNEDCYPGNYGHGCSKKCNCMDKSLCNHVDGTCPEGCGFGFSGASCDIPPFPMFKYPPQLIDSGINLCKIKITSHEILGLSEERNSFIIQYKEKNDETWRSTTTIFADHSIDYSLTYLNADTIYEIRMVTTDFMNYNGTADFIEGTECYTKCIELTPDNIQVTEDFIHGFHTVTRVSFTLKVDSPQACRIENYNYTINNVTGDADNIFFLSLEPFTKYEITFSYKKTQNGMVHEMVKTFTTEEGIPSEVVNWNAEVNPDSFNITWEEPIEKYGIIHQYGVEYKLQRPEACTSDDSNSIYTYMISRGTSILIKDLEPYRKYLINIRAYTGGGSGNPVSICLTTNSSGDLSHEEIKLLNEYSIDVSSDQIALKFNIPCQVYKGRIWARCAITCEEAWCKKPNAIEQEISSTTNMVTINDLSPYVNYSLALNVSRVASGNSKWISTSPRIILTESSAPNTIEHAEMTTNGETIGFRWKPPFPPTGVLDMYSIRYQEKDCKAMESLTNGTKCLWYPRYHCFKIIEGIVLNHRYAIEIYAKNEGNHNFTSILYLGVISAEIRAPWPPYGLEHKWLDDNSLNVSWIHPNNTRGLLTKFIISMEKGSHVETFEKKIYSEEDYRLKYTHKIDYSELRNVEWCKKYDVSVTAENNAGDSRSDNLEIYSPAAVIPNTSISIKSSTNQTVTVSIEGDRGSTINSLHLLISKVGETEENDLRKLEKHVQQNGTKSSYVLEKVLWCNSSHTQANVLTEDYEIGNERNCDSPLEPGQNYSISFLFVNECSGQVPKISRRTRLVTKYMKTKKTYDSSPEVGSGSTGLYALLLLFIIPIAVFGYIYIKRYGPVIESTEDTTLIDRSIPVVKKRAKPKKSLPVLHLHTVNSKKVKIHCLEAYVKHAIETGELENQHNLFPRGLLKAHEYGSLPENKAKNRYKNLISYDHSRVKLRKIAGDEYSDYINANYIDGYNVPRAYIATQGPKQCTLKDFLRMVWQENVQNIIILANILENGKKKVEQYWPDINEEKTFGEITVSFVSQNIFANFEYRKFQVSRKNETRELTQLHFTTWPDHGVPLYSQSMVDFLQKILTIPYDTHSPILVHCSAGVGRTGTIILSDICLRMAAGEGAVDFLAHLEHLRTQRANLVDNAEQYKLAHMVVLECLFGMHTSIPCNDGMPKSVKGILKGNGVQTEMKLLEETQWQDRAMESIMDIEETPAEYPEKNRFNNIVPGKYGIFLPFYPRHDETSSYINAVQVNGFRCPKRFIVTQQPMPNTLGDFWRLIAETESTVILSLNEINSQDRTVCQFWPEYGYEFSPVDFIQIVHLKEQDKQFYKVITVRVEVKLSDRSDFNVDVICLLNWPPNILVPTSTEDFLSFIEEMDVWCRKSQPVVVTCYDGATASGLYVAMSFIIEKMKLEHKCDVCQAVRNIRRNRMQFVSSKEQYEFLYKASVAFLDGFQPYSNFG